MLGVSAVVGIGCIPLLSSLTVILAKFIYYCDKSMARVRDSRIGAVKEFLSGIKVIKLNNFEEYYVRNINEVRESEVKWQRYRYTLGTLWNVIADQLPVISIFVTFIVHTKVFHRTLDASTAFVALTVFNRVKGALSAIPSTLQALLQAKVSLDRLTTYMNQPEIDPPMGESNGRIVCENATIGWPVEKSEDAFSDLTPAFTLRNLNFEPPQGRMTIVCGPLGSGKTLFVGRLGDKS
jgi:ABC-type multidrug transport system fused ATPase/permease subunit